MPKAEIKLLKQQLLFKDCNTKEFDHRKKFYHILEKILIYLGIFEKNLVILAGNETLGGQIKGLKCCLDLTSVLNADKKISFVLERQYLR